MKDRKRAEGAGWNRREFVAAVGAGAVGASLWGSLGLRGAEAAEGRRFRPAVTSAGGVVASISRQASAIGIDVLNAGGSAADAAVAMVFAVGVARPDFGGIGGQGMLVYRRADEQVFALDMGGAAPALVDEAFFSGPGMHHGGPGFTPSVGHRVIPVPGIAAGMAEFLRTHGSGRFSLADLIAPAEQLARAGPIVSRELAVLMTVFQHTLLLYPETARIYGGRPAPGTRLPQTGYADSLRLIMDEGPDAFYRGRIAELIVADMFAAEAEGARNPMLLASWPEGANDKGVMTLADLANYRALFRTPLNGHYRNHQVFAMPPSSGGGVQTLEALNILEGFDLLSFGQSSADHLHVLAEAMKLARADVWRYVADPDFFPEVTTESIQKVTGKEYARDRRSLIDMGQAQIYGSGGVRSKSGHTNHLSVLDREGNAVAVTHSMSSPFGSGVVAPGTGFLLANTLANSFVEPDPGQIDRPRGGARATVAHSPTIVVRNGRPVFVVGAAGGQRLAMGVLQAIVNFVDFGRDIAHAIDDERINAYNVSTSETEVKPRLEMEVDRVADTVEEELTRRKHGIVSRGEYSDGNTAQVQAVGFDPASGMNQAITDPRVGGQFQDLQGIEPYDEEDFGGAMGQ